MKLGSTVKALGCLLAPLWIALAIPLILAYFAFKVLIYFVNDAAAVESDRKTASSARPFQWRSDKTTGYPLGGFRSKRNDPSARQMKRHAEHLISESSLENQTRQMMDYTMISLQQLERIHRRKGMVNETRRLELTKLERRLAVEIERALNMLEDALVSIITVDVTGGNARIDRLVNDLSESNSRLRDIADAHDEIRSVRETWAGEMQ